MQKLLPLIFIVIMLAACGKSDREKIENSLTAMLETYPESRLQDIYKNFYQARFGSEHAVNQSNTVVLRQYIEYEIASAPANSTHLAEEIGWDGAYVRVNIRAVSEGLLTSLELAEIFAASSEKIDSVKIAVWQQEWKTITSIIEGEKLAVADFEQDKMQIDSILQQNPAVAFHHSDAYRQNYSPHYRIVKKTVLKERFPNILNGTYIN